jgi:hypothetical protein
VGGADEPTRAPGRDDARGVAATVDLLVSNGYGTPRAIRRLYSWRTIHNYLDAVARRLHNQNRFRYVLAGGKAEDWPDYEGSENEQFAADAWLDVEARLSASPMVRRVVAPGPGQAQGDPEGLVTVADEDA